MKMEVWCVQLRAQLPCAMVRARGGLPLQVRRLHGLLAGGHLGGARLGGAQAAAGRRAKRRVRSDGGARTATERCPFSEPYAHRGGVTSGRTVYYLLVRLDACTDAAISVQILASCDGSAEQLYLTVDPRLGALVTPR